LAQSPKKKAIGPLEGEVVRIQVSGDLADPASSRKVLTDPDVGRGRFGAVVRQVTPQGPVTQLHQADGFVIALGTTRVDVLVEIPEEAQKTFREAFGYVQDRMKRFSALLKKNAANRAEWIGIVATVHVKDTAAKSKLEAAFNWARRMDFPLLPSKELSGFLYQVGGRDSKFELNRLLQISGFSQHLATMEQNGVVVMQAEGAVFGVEFLFDVNDKPAGQKGEFWKKVTKISPQMEAGIKEFMMSGGTSWTS